LNDFEDHVQPVRSAILATAGLLVHFLLYYFMVISTDRETDKEIDRDGQTEIRPIHKDTDAAVWRHNAICASNTQNNLS